MKVVAKAVLRRLAVLAVVLWIWPALAQDNGEQNAALKAQYDAAFQEMFRNPSDLDLMFKFAGLAMRLGNHEAAISTLERMLIFNPELPRVRLELGVLYLRLGSYSTSRAYLAKAIERKDVPQEVRQRAAAFLAEIDKRQSRHRFTGSAFAGARYQTNANAGPGSPAVRAAGFDAVLDDLFLAQSDENLFIIATVQHDYDLQTQRSETWQTNVLAYASKQRELSELDLGIFEVTTGPRLAFAPEAIEDMTIRPYGLANIVVLDKERFFHTYGAGVHLAKPFGQKVLTDAGYEFRRKLFRSSSDRPTADELSGYEHAVNIGGRFAVTENILFNAHLSAVFLSAKKDYNSNRELAALGGVSIRYDAPFGVTSWPWLFSVSGARIITDYDDPDPAVDPGVTRSDKEWRVAVSNNIGLTRDWSIVVQVQYLRADSNLPNFERENMVALIGASWNF